MSSISSIAKTIDISPAQTEAWRLLDGLWARAPEWPKKDEKERIEMDLSAEPSLTSQLLLDLLFNAIKSSDRPASTQARRAAAERVLQTLATATPGQHGLSLSRTRNALDSALFRFLGVHPVQKIPEFLHVQWWDRETIRRAAVSEPFPWAIWPALFTAANISDSKMHKNSSIDLFINNIYIRDRIAAAGSDDRPDPGTFWFDAIPVKTTSLLGDADVKLIQALRDIAIAQSADPVLDPAAVVGFLSRLTEVSPAIAERFQVKFDRERLAFAARPVLDAPQAAATTNKPRSL